jgi:penicillin amidase
VTTKSRILRVAAAGIALLFITAAALWIGLRASLPTIDGTQRLPGLIAPVSIERDAQGVPTISAGNRADLARGLGFVHGQDRFFQMDLLRRAAAGELSALLGPSLLSVDRTLRTHRLRHTASAVVSAAGTQERAWLEAYAAGVNAGLASLKSRPFEYWLLRTPPKPWTAEDSILCIQAISLNLQDAEGHLQMQRGLLRATLPEAAWRFIEAGAPEWDAAIDGTVEDEPRMPRAEEFDLRHAADLPFDPPAEVLRHLSLLGSNNWVVAGRDTGNGAALVANDMHLELRVPNIWYRARLIQSTALQPLDLTGVTLPGTPSVVAGSNGFIAWGFTSSYAQFATVIRLVPVTGEASEYQTAAGPHSLTYVDEPIDVLRAPTEPFKVALSEWGPVIGKDWMDEPYAIQWTAQDPAATNLNLAKLEQTRSVDAALRIAGSFGIPGLNMMIGDSAGHIGWTLAGRLPIHGPGASGVPQLSTDASVGFSGWLEPDRQPHVIDPPAGFLWSANARVVGGADAALIGDDGMDRGARAGQIRADLENAARPFTAASSLRVQLDDRALFLERWRTLLLRILEASRTAGQHEHDAAYATLARWSGHAAPDDAAYRLVALFREQVQARAFYMLVAPARARDPKFEFEIPSSFEGPLWRLVDARPLNLLAPRYRDWNALLTEALRASEVLPPNCRALQTCTWGQVNAVRVAHPLSVAIPFLAPLLDMPTVMLPGGREDMPRIQGRDFGASERFSVQPGRESQGYFHMPGGQSGHPLSPFYRAGFDDWAQGRATPFLPGPSAHRLVLTP